MNFYVRNRLKSSAIVNLFSRRKTNKQKMPHSVFKEEGHKGLVYVNFKIAYCSISECNPPWWGLAIPQAS